MKHCATLADYQQHYAALRQARPDAIIGLVPTMGALHKGHLSLVKAAQQQCDVVVVYIFVNPMQFGPNEDFDTYPRTMEADLAQCEALGVDVVFSPSLDEIYPQGKDHLMQVVPPENLTNFACGASRPVFFTGIATVLTKMFHLTQPNQVFFGQKDAQQLHIVKRLVSDLNFDIEVVGCPTIREASGLAMSSRNRHLHSDEQKKQALLLCECLLALQQLYRSGKSDVSASMDWVREEIIEPACQEWAESGAQDGRFKLDYLVAVDNSTFQPVSVVNEETRWLMAATVDDVRLIDNVLVGEPLLPLNRPEDLAFSEYMALTS